MPTHRSDEYKLLANRPLTLLPPKRSSMSVAEGTNHFSQHPCETSADTRLPDLGNGTKSVHIRRCSVA